VLEMESIDALESLALDLGEPVFAVVADARRQVLGQELGARLPAGALASRGLECVEHACAVLRGWIEHVPGFPHVRDAARAALDSRIADARAAVAMLTSPAPALTDERLVGIGSF